MKAPAEAVPLPTYKKAVLQIVAYKCVREVVNRVLADCNLNTTQWIILGTLQESPTGLRTTDIAQALQVEVPLITTLVQPLLSDGLVRNRISKTDRRAKPLALTPRGKALVASIEPQLAEHLKRLEIGLSGKQIANYFQTLETFIANA